MILERFQGHTFETLSESTDDQVMAMLRYIEKHPIPMRRMVE